MSPDRARTKARYFAVHGTGTPLGDPIEVSALGQALFDDDADSNVSVSEQLTVGSVKSCYGHTEGAAGLTGVLLVLQAMNHQVGSIGIIIQYCHLGSWLLPYQCLPCSHALRS